MLVEGGVFLATALSASSTRNRLSTGGGRRMSKEVTMTMTSIKVDNWREEKSDEIERIFQQYEIKYSEIEFFYRASGARMMIGQGAFGSVFTATFRGTNCAVKEVIPER